MFPTWRKQLGFLVVLSTLLSGLVPAANAASAPNIITYQGRVLNANGVPVSDTSLSMSFALYTAVTGGTCVWSNSSASCASVTARTVTLTAGLFTENLGDTGNSYAAIGDSIFGDNAALYLEVIIAGETLSPRRQITAAPYALNADTLDGIDSTVLQLFETGSSRTFEDDAPVIVGSNVAFTYGSGGVGDLRAEDELEVMGDGYIDNDLVVGASTSSTETITNAGFSLGGDDLFVAGTLGVEGTIYTDGALDVVGTASVGDLTCTDCLDFSEFSDNMGLDASTTLTMDGSESLTFDNGGSGNMIINLSSTGDFLVLDSGTTVFSISDTDAVSYTTDLATAHAVTLTGNSLTTANLLSLSATGLTTGSALQVSATNANTANTSVRLSQLVFTNSQTTTANTDMVGMGITFSQNPAVAGNTENVLVVTNTPTINTTDTTVSSLLLLDNADTSATGSTVVTDALYIRVSGAISDGVIDAIDVSDSNITNALNFGPNTISGTTGNIDMTNFDLTGSDGSITTNGDLALNGDDITTDGTLTIDSAASTVQLGADDDFLPQLGSGDADLGASGTRWDNIFGVVGNFSGTVTVSDLTCTDCLDFAEFTDTLALDVSTSITMDGSEALTFTNSGSGNVIFNLSSTGDFVLQDNGTTVFSVSDTGVTTIDPTIAGTMLDFELATQWTAGDLINIDWASATTGTSPVTAIDVDFTNFTPDGSTAFNGILVNDQASATGSTEYGINIAGSNWDRALYVEDVSEFREDVMFDDASEGVDVVIGSDNTNTIDLGADVFEAGTFIDIGYDTAETLVGVLRGVNIDFSTSVTGGSGTDVVGVRTLLPTLTASGTSSSLQIGYLIDQSGAVTTSDASTSTVNWLGMRIDMPDINTGNASDSVTSRGIEIIPGTVTNGAGTEEEIGIDIAGTRIDLDLDNDTSLIASTDDRIDWELGGFSQTLIMSTPASASSGTTTSILEMNYATPADTTGTNIHQGLFLDLSVGNATGGTNFVTGLAFDDITGDASVENLHGIDIGALTGTGAANETAIEIGSGWDAEISFLDGTQADIRIPNSSSFAFQDASGNEILSLEDVGNATSHVITIDADTAFSFDSTADTDTDITTASGEDLRIEPGGAGDIVFAVDTDTAFNVRADAAPGVDMVSISNATQAVTSTGINALAFDYSVSNASTSAVLLETTYTGGGTDALSFAALTVDDMNPTNVAGTDTVIAIDIAAVTDPGATITSVGLRIGSGYDSNLILSDSTSIVDVAGGGTITFRDGVNTLMSIADNGTNGILTIDNLSTSASSVNIYDVAVTKTIDIGSVSTDSADTVNIATNNSSADTVSIGNSHVSTVVSLNAGGLIDLEGTVNIDLVTIGATQFAVCHTNADTDDEPIGDCSGAPTADYAEQYPVAEDVEYGDIVVPGVREVVTQDGGTIVELVKSSQPYEGPIVGIVSDNYSDFTSAGYNIDAEDNPLPVALVGRVPVKVTDEGGSISVGDYLTTSSTAGVAMKATKVGRVIGMALEDWDGISATVMVQVNNSWSMGDVIGTDGTSTLVTDNVIVSSVATASADEQTFDSYGLSLRGSAWDGSEAQAVEMMLQNVVESEDSYRLSVRNTSETEVAYITNEGTMKIAGDMVIGGRLYPSDRGTPQTEKYIYYDGSSGAAGDFMRTNAKGWSTGSYDFAEMFPSDEELVSGDIVVFSGDGEMVQQSTGTDGEQLAGIVSTRPGFLAGENVEGAYPIALAGRVPTKVNLENGTIAVGDPLTTSSTSGVAMKASEAGQVVGYALEAYVGTESDSLILAYVNVGYWSGGSQTITIVQNQASQTSSDAQSFSALNMSGNIYMATNQILSIGRLEGISGLWSVESDGTIKTEALVKTIIESYQGTDVETIAVTSPEAVITLTGTSTLEEGRAEVRFEDVLPEFNDVISAIAPIRVIVTPSGPVSLYVSEKDQNHFIVERFVGSADVEFDWMVTGYRKGYEPEEEEEVVEEEIQSESSSTGTESVVEDVVEETVEPEPESASIEESAEEEEPATPESPDENLIDSATEAEGDVSVEPADVVIEESSTQP